VKTLWPICKTFRCRYSCSCVFYPFFFFHSNSRLPRVTSQWGEPLIIAYDVGYGTEEDVATIEARAQDPIPELDYTEFAIVKRDGFLFDCVDLCIEEGSRTCIVGPGISTSCLTNVLAKRLAPVEGTVHHPSGVSIGYCDSRAINEMISNTGQTTSALEYLSRLYPKKMD
ncbi:MAG: ATPase subunit of ABC transporter with duplicated ATPase domains, partial [Bacillariaceae sp.]